MKMLVVFAALSGMTLVAAAAEPGGRELDLVLTRNPNLSDGAALYATCAACHGPNGEGASDGTVPALVGQPYTVLAAQIVGFRAGQREDSRMNHFSDRRHLSFSQPIADVAAYISKLKPAPSAASRPDVGDARGAMTYARACERCHGPIGEGNDDTTTPRLASQHYEYLVKQLDDAAHGRRPVMAEAHAKMTSAVSAEDLTNVTRYLASLPR